MLTSQAKLCSTDLQLKSKILGFSVAYTKKYDVAVKKLTCIERFHKKVETEVLDAMNNLQDEEKMAAIEKCMIVQAMGFKQGHWYKCPNGHPYVIGECGGAMEIAKCNECGAKIGGTHHSVLSSNQLASEMDGAANPAWPQ